MRYAVLVRYFAPHDCLHDIGSLMIPPVRRREIAAELALAVSCVLDPSGRETS